MIFILGVLIGLALGVILMCSIQINKNKESE